VVSCFFSGRSPSDQVGPLCTKKHRNSVTQKGGDAAYLHYVARTGRRRHPHTYVGEGGDGALGRLEPEVWRHGQLLLSCGDSRPPGSGEGPAHLATHRGPKDVTSAEDEPSALTDKTSTTVSGPDGEEPWSLPDDHASGGKPFATAARGQGL
jgi:hypothetical protein